MSLVFPGSCIPDVRYVGAGATVMRRISSLAGGVEVTRSSGDLHGASNTPGL